ncbi:NADP-dependent oxidoreductase domain-containing protein [Lipomyces tetrasporus]
MEFLAVLDRNNVEEIDTAFLYTGSERALAEAGAPARFTIGTKSPGFYKKALSEQSVLAAAKKSFDDIGVPQVETYFLHSPDSDTPLDETLRAVQDLYEAGKSVQFGLSNFTAKQVQEVYDVMSAKGQPSVFQGNYNAVARSYDSELIPLLRKLGMKFYAYSPIAGGFLVKSSEAIETGVEGGRWDKESPAGQLYRKLYNRPKLLTALDDWESISKDAGVSKAALAYRWVTLNSSLNGDYGDGVIIGASKVEHLQESLKALQDGPLPSSVVAKINRIWENIKYEAPVDNFHG